MSGTLGTRLVWSLAVLFIQNAEATIFIPCPSVQRDFYPGVEPQNSSPPYVLNVTDEDGQPLPDLSYYGGHLRYNVSLSGIRTGNKTETFVGFIIYIYNESADKPSGHFVTPLPQGVQKEECHFEIPRDETNEVALNSTSKERTDLQIEWISPQEHPAGIIHIRASVIKEYGVYWDGIELTLISSQAAITVQSSSLCLIVIALLYSIM